MSVIPKRNNILIKRDYTLENAYAYYKKNVNNPLDKKTYKAYIHELFETLMHEIVYNSAVITLPGSLGRLGVVAKKTIPYIKDDEVQVPIDWGATLKLWNERPEMYEKRILVYHKNNDIGYLKPTWTWKKRRDMGNKFLYKFKPIRRRLREPTQLLKSKTPNIFYYESFR